MTVTAHASLQDDPAEFDSDDTEIDENLAKNLLQGFRNQAGMPGPASNLLNIMGSAESAEDEDVDR